MKVFNKIAACTFAATMMVTQAQAIELVKVEPVAKFSITQSAQESLAESMKLNTSNKVSVKVSLDIQKAQVNYLSENKPQGLTKASLVTE